MLKIIRTRLFLIVPLLALAFVSCDKDKTYSDYLEDEKDYINSKISKDTLAVTSETQSGLDEWFDENGHKLYYKFSDGLYYHQISKGDTSTLAPKTGCSVYVRYIGICLNDGVVYSNTSSAVSANPEKLKLLSSPDEEDVYGEGFQKAVRQMYAGGHCTCIIPFKIANCDDYNNDKRTMFYEIWVTRIE